GGGGGGAAVRVEGVGSPCAREERPGSHEPSQAVAWLHEANYELTLAAAPAHLYGAAEALHERDDRGVVAAHRRNELSDSGCSCVGGERAAEGRSDSAALLAVP